MLWDDVGLCFDLKVQGGADVSRAPVRSVSVILDQ